MAQETPEAGTGPDAVAGPVQTNGAASGADAECDAAPMAKDFDAENEATVEITPKAGHDSAIELAPDAGVTPAHTRVFTLHHAQPFESPGRSARNHWTLITVFALVGTLLGAAFGFAKTPTYTAEARLVVGKTAQLSNLASIPGLDAAGQSLASSYSRLATTDSVLQATAKRLGGTLDGGLSASPIPLSPIVLVEGSATTSGGAVAIAEAGSAALIAAVNQLNADQNKAADQLLGQYKAADRQLLLAQAALKGAQADLARLTAAGSNIDDAQAKVNTAQTDVDAAQVKANALQTAYNGVFNPTAINTQILQSVGTAKPTGSNRKSTLELGLLVGLVAGGLLGLGLCVLLDLRARRHA